MTAFNWEPLDLGEVVTLLGDLPARWWIAGGWALELHLGRAVRGHEDVDVMVLRDDQRALQRHLAGWDLRIAHEGKLEPWAEGERVELPRHGVWARRAANGPWELEFLLGEHEEGLWRYRRDPRVALPVDEIGLRTETGIPYLRPELILLFKSKAPREGDEADLAAVLPALDAEGRARLAAWLLPDHPWRARI